MKVTSAHPLPWQATHSSVTAAIRALSAARCRWHQWSFRFSFTVLCKFCVYCLFTEDIYVNCCRLLLSFMTTLKKMKWLFTTKLLWSYKYVIMWWKNVKPYVWLQCNWFVSTSTLFFTGVSLTHMLAHVYVWCNCHFCVNLSSALINWAHTFCLKWLFSLSWFAWWMDSVNVGILAWLSVNFLTGE